MARIKTPEEIEILREGGRRLATVLDEVAQTIKPGVTTAELDELAERLIREGGDEPAFKGYNPGGPSGEPFPATLCVSTNHEIVHGLPKREKVLEEGDIVGIDCGLIHKGLYTDMARTIPVGKISETDERLMEVTRKSLYKGISAVKNGARVGDIGYAIEEFVKPYGYGIVRDMGGHGLGHAVHEPPFIPHFGKKGTGDLLETGMVIAIEPMINLGVDDIKLGNDRFTYETRDGKKSAHFEVTLAVTDKGADILTQK